MLADCYLSSSSVGWSFGGIIAVEIARLLDEAPADIKIAGILMVDSFCPWAKGPWTSQPAQPRFRSTTTEKMKELTLTAFKHAREMITSWEKPAEFQAPPVVMIQAEEVRQLDTEDGKLGWSELPSLRFLSIEVVPGDHFSMFNDERVCLEGGSDAFKLTALQVEGVTAKMRDACKLFDAR